MNVLLGKTTCRRGLTKIQTQPSEADLSIQFIKPFYHFMGLDFGLILTPAQDIPPPFQQKSLSLEILLILPFHLESLYRSLANSLALFIPDSIVWSRPVVSKLIFKRTTWVQVFILSSRSYT